MSYWRLIVGRPSKYKPEVHIDAAVKLYEAGYTDAQVATVFCVTEQTLNNWKNDYPVFFESLKSGKNMSDDAVEKSLYKRANGYEVPFEETEEGETEKGVYSKVKRGVKHLPGDVTAQIFWLKNRRPDRWRDRQDLTVDVTNISPEERQRRIDELISKRGA
jgi:hypothetical protein